jgi:hypothetical protein
MNTSCIRVDDEHMSLFSQAILLSLAAVCRTNAINPDLNLSVQSDIHEASQHCLC